jgi:hypothetical protein
VGYRCTAPFMGWNMACTVVLFSAVSSQCHRPDTGQPECLELSRSALGAVVWGDRFGASETTVQPRSRSMVFSSSKIASSSKLRRAERSSRSLRTSSTIGSFTCSVSHQLLRRAKRW